MNTSRGVGKDMVCGELSVTYLSATQMASSSGLLENSGSFGRLQA
ncbi:MAG TPA: hypothetical protein VN577_12430 [Terriglobales bacterium]|nr:hypothetical protein [Terriglobales bacterium]